MFSCRLCGRAYATQNSLTRHSHNHGEDKSHACTECHVVFSRRDLLVRHSKIHAASNAIGRPGGRRLRTHTACVNCRRSRTKCDGDGTKPCTSCSNTNQECTFSAASHRVSEDIRIKERDHSRSDSAGQQSTFDDSFDFSTVLPSTDHPQPLQNMNDDVFQPVLNQTSLSSSQITRWPWLHEALFFQNDTPKDLHQPVMDHPGNGENADHSTLLDDISSHPFNLSCPVVAMHFSQELIHDAALRNVPHQSTENAIAQPSAQPKSTSLSDETRIFTNTNSGLVPPRAQSESDHIVMTQTAVVKELVAYARMTSLNPQAQQAPSDYWHSISVRVQKVFHFSSVHNSNCKADHCLNHFVKLYQDNFFHLWPFFARHTFDPTHLHPVLYLTLGSIGSMYGGSESSQYGSLMHEHLQDFLAESLFNHQHTDDDSVSIAQARSLCQLSALYFGHKRAFSHAQHLGSILLAQARRMDLFSPLKFQKWPPSTPDLDADSAATAQFLAHWVRAETRKQLAYSILRLDVYTSVLLNTKPLLSFEEIQLELPCTSRLWLTKFSSNSQFVAAIQQESASNDREKVPFCDTVRLVMDKDEHPPFFDAMFPELLLFGLQQHVWRLCHDVEALVRLIGMQISPELPFNGLDAGATSNSRVPLVHARSPTSIDRSQVRSSREQFQDHLLQRFRHMDEMRQDQERILRALRKWRHIFNHVYTAQLNTEKRGSLISSLLLYHLSFLRVFAPLDKLHNISYRASSGGPVDQEILNLVWTWSQSEQCRIAVQHACIIWNLMNVETQQFLETQARYSFMAVTSLHHAAVVVWTFAGTHEEQSDLMLGNDDTNAGRVPIVKEHSQVLMALFVRLFNLIRPAWALQSSFSAAAVRLSGTSFPLRPV